MTTHSDPLRLRASTIGKEGRLMAMWPEEVPAETPAAIEDLEARGIYELEYRVEGCPAFVAFTRRKAVVGRGARVVWPGENELDIIGELAIELDAIDPIRRTHLKLVVDPTSAPPSKPLTLSEALDSLEPHEFARWLYGSRLSWQ